MSQEQFVWVWLFAQNILIALGSYAITGSVDPFLIATAFFCFCVPPTVIFHELAHALAAKAIKGRVIALRLGLTQVPTGPHFSFQFLAFRWQIYALPVTGSVIHTYPNPVSSFRTKAAFVTAAAPLTNLVLAALALPWALHGRSPFVEGIAWAWVATNLLSGVLSLMPFNIGGDKRLQSDGRRIWNTLRLNDDQVMQKLRESQMVADYYDEKEAMQKLTVNEAFALYEKQPDRVSVLANLIDKLTDASDPRQFEIVAKLLEHPEVKPPNAAQFLDSFITGHVSKGTINGNVLFDSLTEKLLDLSKNSVTARGTRGSVLIDLGRYAEGREMLKAVLKETKSKFDRIYVHIFLGLASKAQGDLPLAKKHAVWARKLDRHCPALKRVADLLEPNQRRS